MDGLSLFCLIFWVVFGLYSSYICIKNIVSLRKEFVAIDKALNKEIYLK